MAKEQSEAEQVNYRQILDRRDRCQIDVRHISDRAHKETHTCRFIPACVRYVS